ncbi:MAG: sensor histidine kinase [Thermoleophilaceae bacterium]
MSDTGSRIDIEGSYSARALALLRLAAVPVIFVGERLVEHPKPSDRFDAVLAVMAVYAVAALVLTRRREGPRVPLALYAVLDLAFICVLAYYSGGAFSQLRYAFFVLPVAAILLPRPAVTAAASAASVGAYVLVSLVHPATSSRQDFEFVLTQVLYLTWIGIGAVLISRLLARRGARIEQLAASRGRLVAQAMDAEDRERRRLAEALHDEAIQNLLAARQDLDGTSADSLARAQLGLDRTVSQLREAIFDLHPYVLEQAGLEAALRAVADQHARRAGFEATVSVAPAATGYHDELLLSIGRELMANAARHAKASRFTLALDRVDGDLVLEVSDDGRGIDEREVADALARGHIGLASCAERAEALDGSFSIRGGSGEGTRVRITLPAEPAGAASNGHPIVGHPIE